MKRWMTVVLLIATVLAVAAQATEPPMELDPAKWAVTGVGGANEFHLRIGRTGSKGGEAGLWGAWFDGLIDDDLERYGGGIYGTYPIVKDGKWNLALLLPFGLTEALPALSYDAYLGLMGGIAEDVDEDGYGGVAATIVGIQIGVLRAEYLYYLTDGLASFLPDVADRHVILVGAQFRF